MIELTFAKPVHLNRIANNIREIDAREIKAVTGQTAKEGLRASLRHADFALTAMLDDKPIAMMGVRTVSAIDQTGVPWFLGTDEVSDCVRDFVKYGPRVLKAMHTHCKYLENYVARENYKALRLLRFLGFEIDEQPYIMGGIEFKRFWRHVH